MLKHSLRQFTFTAYRAAQLATKIDMANQYGVQVAKAQGPVDGFVGGMETFRKARLVFSNPLQRLVTLLSFGSNDCQKRRVARS